uniref:glutathione transferase n=1 Tax=Allium sativum TaxID=4682 RepID=A0A5J6YHL6_ALLSA|nr:glutathione S-transferase [Allium sativum]
MSEEVLLLETWVSPFAHRARIALEEKGIKFITKQENIHDKSDLLLKSNPIHKTIPVLFHNGKVVCESTLIVEYIDDAWSTVAPFFPKNPYEKYQVKFWANYVESKVWGAGVKIWQEKGEAREEAKKAYIDILKVLETELGDKKYFGGETFNYVDIVFCPFNVFLYTYEKHANFSAEKEIPKLVAYANRCLERPSVAKTLPDPKKTYEYILELKKKLGIEE